jgi:prevent-host-death family protein
MKTITATEAARNFSKLLDMLEQGTEEIVVVRNHHPVARLVPGAPRITALEALSDLQGTISDQEGSSWLRDSRIGRRTRKKVRDPWA